MDQPGFRNLKNFLSLFAVSMLCQLSNCQEEVSGLVIEPQNSRVEKAGDRKLYTCKHSINITNVMWLSPAGVALNRSLPGFSVQTSETAVYLTFLDISPDMNGTYTCQGYDQNAGKIIKITKEVGVYTPIGFVETNSTQAFELHEGALVQCHVTGNPPGEIEWIKDNIPITEKDQLKRIHLDEEGNLFLRSLQKSDEGNYTCLARELSHGQVIQTDIFLDVEFPPDNLQMSHAVKGFTGSNLTLTCTAEAEPEPTYRWYHESDLSLEGEILVTEGITDKGLAGSALEIRNAQVSDAGTYTCEVTNSRGNISGSTSVIVYVASEIKDTKNASAKEGDVAQISCTATGVPEPRVEIYRNNKKMEDGKSGVNSSIVARYNGTTASIRFGSVRVEDSGFYECRAENMIGNSSAFLSLEVLVLPKITVTRNASVEEGAAAEIYCFASGVPEPTVQIFRNDELAENFMSSEDSSARIAFNPALRKDAGEYQCVASNNAGETKANLLLEVLYSPRETSLPNVYACPNQEAVLICQFDAYPSPDLVWGRIDETTSEKTELIAADDATLSHTQAPAESTVVTKTEASTEVAASSNPDSTGNPEDSEESEEKFEIDDDDEVLKLFTSRNRGSVFEPITTDESKVIERIGDTLKLSILEVDDDSYGKYYCKASNSEGNSTAFAELIKATSPAPPTDVKVSEITTKSALISFSQPPNTTVRIISYEITIFNKEADTLSVEQMPADAGSEFLEKILKLQHNTKYEVTVTATNCMGGGEASAPLQFNTLPIEKPDPILILSPATSEHLTNYTINWKTGADGGGNLQRLTISYKPITTDKSSMDDETITINLKSSDPEFASQSYTITELKPSTEYEVTVVVFNEVGETKTVHVFATAAESTGDKNNKEDKPMNVKWIIIVIIIILILLIVLVTDIVCCATRHCGLFHCIYLHTCAPSGTLKPKDPEAASDDKRLGTEGRYSEHT